MNVKSDCDRCTWTDCGGWTRHGVAVLPPLAHVCRVAPDGAGPVRVPAVVVREPLHGEQGRLEGVDVGQLGVPTLAGPPGLGLGLFAAVPVALAPGADLFGSIATYQIVLL